MDPNVSDSATATPLLSGSDDGRDVASNAILHPSSASVTTGSTPPYWGRHRRTHSDISYASVANQSRPTLITLEDHTTGPRQQETNGGLWAKGVTINDHVVVTGTVITAGSYVVWHCTVETLDVRM